MRASLWTIVIAAVIAFQLPVAVRGEDPPATNTPAGEEAAKTPQDSTPNLPPTIDGAAELLSRLKPDQLKSVADMIEQNWTERPEWAEMAIAVMRDQAMVQGGGWWRSTEKKYGWTWLKRRYDKNGNNIIERDELIGSGSSTDLYFRRLDQDLDGRVSSADFDTSVYQNAGPAAQLSRMSRMLFSRLDADTNGQVSKEELSQFFDDADVEKSKFLTSEDILTALMVDDSPPQADSADPTTAQMMNMFFSGQLGWFEEGPKLGERAPLFTLGTHESDRKISLAESIEKKPVVLIFGSFT